MEYTLRDAFLNGAFYYGGVLILVLMEDTLRDCVILYILCVLLCLNPCFNGRYSQRNRTTVIVGAIVVLILVLMEDTLRVHNKQLRKKRMKSLSLF